MSVRAAKFTDIKAIIAMMERAHQASRYAELTFDKEAAQQLLVRSMQRHGHKNYGGALVLVSEKDGEITGFMVGFLDEVYPCLKELRATDLLFRVENDNSTRDSIQMIGRVINWAQSNPKVVDIVLGATDIMGEWDEIQRFYEGLGFEQCGGLFRYTREVAQCRAS